MLIDTHCHLDFEDFEPDRDEVINRARTAGVEIMINVGSSIEGSRRSVELAKRYDFIYAAVGIHPHNAQKADEGAFNELKELASFEKVVAVGEVGLDYYRNLSPRPVRHYDSDVDANGVSNGARDVQKGCFRKFILLSKELNLPLILHNRDAHQDMLAVLKEEFGEGRVRGVMHCFSGDTLFLKQCLDMGLYISFTCNLTFKNAKGLRELASQVPIEKLLLETDAPFLAPQAHRGKRNEPAYLTFLLEGLSDIHSISKEDIARITTHNANELFGLGIGEPKRIAYNIRDSLYLNITNRCTSECSFCIRFFSNFVKGHNLQLDREPSVKDILDEIGDVERYKEIVFCGYGEPTLRLDVLKEVAGVLKEKKKRIRLVTNGHGNLINKRSIAKELAGLVDAVSVSLNVDTEEKYNRICRPQFGQGTFEEVKRFIRESRDVGMEVEVTCLDIRQTDVERCRIIAEDELGVKFRLRKFNVVG